MIEKHRRIVVDTNVFVSAAPYPNSPPGRALAKALLLDTVLTSTEAWQELHDVMQQPKFNRIVPLDLRQEYLTSIQLSLKLVDINFETQALLECRDPDDNKFLSLALNGNANLIITGDLDLLSLHPWRGIPILTPADYLARTCELAFPPAPA